MSIEITQDYVVYQAQTKLLDLCYEIAQSRSITKPNILALRQQTTMIRLWLKALNDNYIDRATRERIWYALMDIGQLNDIPYAPSIINVTPPSIIIGVKGDKGDTGKTGATGGGIAFSASNVGMDTVVDSFDISLSPAAEWQYTVTSGSNLRVETLTGGWLSNGSQFVDDGGVATTDIGDTSSIYFSVNVSGTTAQLIMHVPSGTWNVVGSRIFIPVTGNGITLPTSLANGYIWIGNSSNQPTQVLLSGDVTISNTGVSTINYSSSSTSNNVINSINNATSSINVNKLAALTPSKAVVTDSSGFLTTSSATATQVGYLSNVTSDIQTQINTIAGAGTITGAITTYVASNATASRAIVSNASGKLTTAITTDTEISYVNGVTSAIQTQLDSKQASLGYTPVNKAGDTMSGALAMGGNKITGLAAATTNGDAVRFEQLDIGYTPLTSGGSLINGWTGNVSYRITPNFELQISVQANSLAATSQTMLIISGLSGLSGGLLYPTGINRDGGFAYLSIAVTSTTLTFNSPAYATSGSNSQIHVTAVIPLNAIQ